MNKKDILQNVMSKIKEGGIKPSPKSFDYKNIWYWAALSVMIGLGAVSLALIVFRMLELGSEWRYYLRSARVIFIVLPYLWIAFFMGFITLGIISFRKTKRGYRHNNLMIGGFILLTIFVLGIIAHGFHAGDCLSRSINKNAPFLRIGGPDKEVIWKNPERGMLGGRIIKLNKRRINLKSFRGEVWNVSYSDKTRMRSGTNLKEGTRVVIIGKKVGEYDFEAFGIRIAEKFPHHKREHNKNFENNYR